MNIRSIFSSAALLIALVSAGYAQTLTVNAGQSRGVFDLLKVDSLVFGADNVKISLNDQTSRTYTKVDITSIVFNKTGLPPGAILGGKMVLLATHDTVTYNIADLDSIWFTTSTPDKDYTMPGVGVLGCGYDVFGEYANATSIRSRALTLGALTKFNPYNDGDTNHNYQKPASVTLTVSEHGNFSSISGSNYIDFSNQLAVKAGLSGSYGFFSGSIQSNFDLSKAGSSHLDFARVTDQYDEWVISLPDTSTDEFKQLLTKDFKADINDSALSPLTLFGKYGTHILRSIIVGARADYSVSTQITSTSQKWDCGLYAKVSYNNLVSNVSASIGVYDTNTYRQYLKNSSSTLRVWGGDVRYSNFAGDSAVKTKWIESIRSNPVFCDFAPQGLVPIWSFCSSPARRQAVMDAYGTYAASQGSTLPFNSALPRRCITSIVTLVGKSPAVPGGYTFLGTDLNQGAGGDYIYLAYKLDSTITNASPDTVITNLTLLDGNGAATPAGYTKMNLDLNQGAMGDYIYLAYKRGPARDSTSFANAISNIQIQVGQGAPPFNWELVTWSGTANAADVNRGAGGDYIFIKFTRVQ